MLSSRLLVGGATMIRPPPRQALRCGRREGLLRDRHNLLLLTLFLAADFVVRLEEGVDAPRALAFFFEELDAQQVLDGLARVSARPLQRLPNVVLLEAPKHFDEFPVLLVLRQSVRRVSAEHGIAFYPAGITGGER